MDYLGLKITRWQDFPNPYYYFNVVPFLSVEELQSVDGLLLSPVAVFSLLPSCVGAEGIGWLLLGFTIAPGLPLVKLVLRAVMFMVLLQADPRSYYLEGNIDGLIRSVTMF